MLQERRQGHFEAIVKSREFAGGEVFEVVEINPHLKHREARPNIHAAKGLKAQYRQSGHGFFGAWGCRRGVFLRPSMSKTSRIDEEFGYFRAYAFAIPGKVNAACAACLAHVL